MNGKDAGFSHRTYPVRVAASVTGLKPELIRAWETRYDAVQPSRTAGGSRRYSDSDLIRLKLLRDVVDAGHRIGRVAHLGQDDLRLLLPRSSSSDSDSIERLISIMARLDGFEAHRQLLESLLELGEVEFAKKVVLPLLSEIGQRWQRGEINVSVEHLASGIIRSLLMSTITPASDSHDSRRIVFATPSGEPHDLGTLVASLVAMKAGADIVFLGADVPIEDVVEAVVHARASVLVLGLVTLPEARAVRTLEEIRSRLPERIGCWIGGAGISGLEPIEGVERISNLDQLEAHVRHLVLGGAAKTTTERVQETARRK